MTKMARIQKQINPGKLDKRKEHKTADMWRRR
jgi:hypothetical protein